MEFIYFLETKVKQMQISFHQMKDDVGMHNAKKLEEQESS